MSVDMSDVAALLPADRRVGDVTIVDLSVGDDVDGDGDDVVVVTLTLAPPAGETWSPASTTRLRSILRQGIAATGENRRVMVLLELQNDPGNPAQDAPPDPHR